MTIFNPMEDKECTLYCGNLPDRVTEELLYELFVQAGPLKCVTIPKDKDGRQKSFGFISYKHAISVPYALALFYGISLYGRTLSLKQRTGSAAESEFNPYLEKLLEYHNPYLQTDYNSNNIGYSPRDHRSFQMNNIHRHSRTEQGSWNRPPDISPISYPSYNGSYTPNRFQNHGRRHFTSTPSYPSSYPSSPINTNWNGQLWSGNQF